LSHPRQQRTEQALLLLEVQERLELLALLLELLLELLRTDYLVLRLVQTD
jgi:hypothetical protein